jgi:redox-sensing transcriptional repressor
MAKMDHIPAPAVRRLSLYLRQLETLQAGDRKTVSSRQLGGSLGLSDAQVRKDLAYFGQFGHPGVGYRVPELVQRLRRILGTDKKTGVLLVGAGNLGRALIAYRGFAKRGFDVVAVFDNDADKLGRDIPGRTTLKIQPLSELPTVAKKHAIRVGILAVPAASAQAVAELMVFAGIRGILNFAPTTLQVGEGVSVSSVDLAVHLEQLSYKISAVPA